MQTQRLAAALAVSLPLLLVTAWLVRRRLKKAEPTPEPAAAEDAAAGSEAKDVEIMELRRALGVLESEQQRKAELAAMDSELEQLLHSH